MTRTERKLDVAYWRQRKVAILERYDYGPSVLIFYRCREVIVKASELEKESAADKRRDAKAAAYRAKLQALVDALRLLPQEPKRKTGVGPGALNRLAEQFGIGKGSMRPYIGVISMLNAARKRGLL